MTNKDKIEKFMSEIDSSWGDLKKLRYICVKLCEIYEYDPKYAYADSEGKTEYMNKLYEKMFNQTEEEKDASIDYENIHKICVDLFNIYIMLVKRAGISEEKYEIIGQQIYYTDEEEIYCIIPVEELFCVKTKSSPKGFNKSGKSVWSMTESDMVQEVIKLSKGKQQNVDTKVLQIDKEIGFVGEDGYVGAVGNITEEHNAENIEDLTQRLEDVLQKGGRYLESVIGTEIHNVELHKYYKYLLKTGFPNNHCIVKPLATPKLENIEYVVLAKINSETNECISFLYDKFEKIFHRKTIEEIREMIQELGLSDVGKNDMGCIDSLCDAGR